jgi:hypothetical protein
MVPFVDPGLSQATPYVIFSRKLMSMTRDMLAARQLTIDLYDPSGVVMLQSPNSREFCRCDLMQYRMVYRWLERHVAVPLDIAPNHEKPVQMRSAEISKLISGISR